MRTLIVSASLLLVLESLSWAQEEGSSASRFFRGRRVSFWGEEKEAPRPLPAPGAVESLWAEPIKTPDGKISVYVPPKAIVDFLDSPTLESGRAYLAWQKERMERIARASEILSRLVEESRPPEKIEVPAKPAETQAPAEAPPRKVEPSGTEKPTLPPHAGASEILYFKMDGCPHCKREDETLAELVKERPSVKVRVLKPNQEEALWNALDVKVVPTLVIRSEDGRVQMVRGYTSKNVLLEKLGGTK